MISKISLNKLPEELNEIIITLSDLDESENENEND